jgi:hypothetical protein
LRIIKFHIEWYKDYFVFLLIHRVAFDQTSFFYFLEKQFFFEYFILNVIDKTYFYMLSYMLNLYCLWNSPKKTLSIASKRILKLISELEFGNLTESSHFEHLLISRPISVKCRIWLLVHAQNEPLHIMKRFLR